MNNSLRSFIVGLSLWSGFFPSRLMCFKAPGVVVVATAFSLAVHGVAHFFDKSYRTNRDRCSLLISMRGKEVEFYTNTWVSGIGLCVMVCTDVPQLESLVGIFVVEPLIVKALSICSRYKIVPRESDKNSEN